MRKKNRAFLQRHSESVMSRRHWLIYKRHEKNIGTPDTAAMRMSWVGIMSL